MRAGRAVRVSVRVCARVCKGARVGAGRDAKEVAARGRERDPLPGLSRPRTTRACGQVAGCLRLLPGRSQRLLSDGNPIGAGIGRAAGPGLEGGGPRGSAPPQGTPEEPAMAPASPGGREALEVVCEAKGASGRGAGARRSLSKCQFPEVQRVGCHFIP